MTRFPPGPKQVLPGITFLRFRKNPLAFLENLARQFGDIAYWRLGRENIFLVNHPDLIREVLVTRSDNFIKGLDGAKKLLGEGLLTSDGQLHRCQRQQVQPAFHHQRIASFAETMVKQAERARDQWRNRATVDVTSEMLHVTLAIAGETLFGSSLESHADDIGAALTATMGSPANMLLPFAQLVEKLPLPAVRRIKAGRALLKATINRLIDQRRASKKGGADVLSMLLFAHETDGQVAMSDKQLHDEVMTLLIASHETTSDALNWTWYLLARHPDIEATLHKELRAVLGNRLPTLADIKALTFTENVFRESLRLYSPLWMMWRRAVNDFEVSDYTIPAGSIVAMSQYVMHRDGRFFAEPLRFAPERWTADFKATLPRYAYFPFGGGERQCIGDGFAWMEGILVLATIAQQWKLRLFSGQRVVPQPLVTLRPKGGLRMMALRR